MPPFQANAVHYTPDFRQRVIACGVKLKGLPDKDRPVFIRIDRLGVLVVDVTERGAGGPDTIAKFLAEASLDVLREVVHIVLRLPEGDRQHELALRCGVKPKGRELQGGDLADVHQIDNAPAIY
ncbi:MAG TPA: hypothetical protein PK523_04440 [Elusimicrobiales bacterium]|nr:hypothetical protein [Elusimicrobiales bacterium]